MASNQLHVECTGAPISDLTVKDGKVQHIGFNAPAWWFIDFAQIMVSKAAERIPHMQRPLQRKLDTVVNKMAELVKDMKAHEQYCKELEERKAERREETRERQLDKKFEKFVGSGRLEKMMGMLGH